MIINTEDTVLEYLNKYGFLFENKNDVLLQENDFSTKEKISQIRRKYEKRRRDLEEYKEKALEKLKEFGESMGQSLADETNEKIKEKIEIEKRKIKTYYLLKKRLLLQQEKTEVKNIIIASKAGALILGGMGLASILIFSSYKVYKNNKAKYEKQCKNKVGKNKDKCIIKAKIEALKKRHEFLNNVITKCNKSNNPIKCKAKIDRELIKIRERIRNNLTKFGRDVTGGEDQYV